MEATPPDDYIVVTRTGADLLHDPALNKGTAFTEEERIELGLEGLLPHHVSLLSEQVERVLENFRRRLTPLDKYIYLRSLQDRNETLFFAALVQHLAEMMPVVYTPTVAEAVEEFSHIFRSPRGLYLTPEDVDRMDMVFANAPCQDVGIIVCTDNEGILGIGDQGTGGMAIPIGKLALYVAAGGFHPSCCLPVCLDVGTENPKLLDDPLYLGVKQHRLVGREYEEFIDAFVTAVQRCTPGAVLQWEDFSREKAMDNLLRYREVLPSFNDDIQGTAVVTVAALMGAARLAGRPFRDQVVCIVGAGCAGVGVAEGIITALQEEGLAPEEARRRVLVVDSRGLLTADRSDLDPYKRRVAIPEQWVADWTERSLHAVIAQGRATALIGLSGHPGAIDEEAARLMCANTARPAIFPMSNPTSKAEASPADLMKWTDGAAIVATGSPFNPVLWNGREWHFSQANNVYAFPGIGLGAHACRARMISDGMLTAATRALSALTGEDDLAEGRVLPPIDNLRLIAAHVAAAVAQAAQREGLAQKILGGDIARNLYEAMYVPKYRRYVLASG